MCESAGCAMECMIKKAIIRQYFFARFLFMLFFLREGGVFGVVISEEFSEVTAELSPVSSSLRKTSCATERRAPFLFLSGL